MTDGRSAAVLAKPDRNLLSSNKKLSHQIFPFDELLFELIERVFAVKVEFLKLLIQRSGVMSRRPKAAFHH
jgi:hypothetical protein